MYANTNISRDKPSPAQSWHDFGDGFGAKSSSLKDNGALLSTAGFKIPTTARIGTSITNEIIETIRKTAVPIDSDSAAFFPTESISAAHPSLAKIVQDALSALNNPPYVAVRSDPFGDDTGIGVYESFLVDTRDVNKVIEAVIRVVGSHEIEEAVAFRRELNLKDGIAVMIQPVVGDSYETFYECPQGGVKAFGPAWSLTLQVGAQVEAFAVPGLGSPMDPLLLQSQQYLPRGSSYFSGNNQQSISNRGRIVGHGLCQSNDASSVQAVAMPYDISKILGATTCKVKEALEQLSQQGRQYLEVCIDWRGELHAIQYGMVEIPPLEDQTIIATTGLSVIHGSSPIGRASIANAHLLFCKNPHLVDAKDLIEFLTENDITRRSVALVPSTSALRALLTCPRDLWGKYKNIGAIIVPTYAEDHKRPIEAHLHGALRKGGIGFCEILGDSFGHQPARARGAISSGCGEMVLLKSCIHVVIDEATGRSDILPVSQ